MTSVQAAQPALNTSIFRFVAIGLLQHWMPKLTPALRVGFRLGQVPM
jgi:hypothetical protein